ncbi:hypothetical protein [Rhodococcus sp. H29-C3]|uniref:hypothetical protein n=1 Tax=Rhodococcus sp. H29-C3 TaxID=3046307 RepID=UPI0024B8A5BB|nr:hypothetical protein [Rhodococcus sp. H29-C3]MDJ0361937.1 hypothetical protein [Rhodococcus sp. H29-C3]
MTITEHRASWIGKWERRGSSFADKAATQKQITELTIQITALRDELASNTHGRPRIAAHSVIGSIATGYYTPSVASPTCEQRVDRTNPALRMGVAAR